MPTFLHVSCGARRKADSTPVFAAEDWTEVRMDADPAAEPDVVGTLADMSGVAAGAVDAVLVREDFRRLDAEQVQAALRELRRVLKPVGVAVVATPDPLAPEGAETDPPAAPAAGNVRAHPLVKLLEKAGFVSIAVRRTDGWALQLVASKGRRGDPVMEAMLRAHFAR